MNILNSKIDAKTEDEAREIASKTSIERDESIYLYFCSRKKEYTIHRFINPFAPIFSGGYVPELVALFFNGVEISRSTI